MGTSLFPTMMKIVLLAALVATVSAKSLEMPKSLDIANMTKKQLLAADDCEGGTDVSEDMNKCMSKMPQGADLLKCIKADGDSYKLTCEDAKCKEFIQCLVKAYCKAIKTTKNPAGCEKEAFKNLDSSCNAKCDNPLVLIIIIVVVVLLLAGIGIYCYCKKKNAGGEQKS